MTGIAALTILLCVYAAGELIAQKTKAVFSTVLGIALILLAGFWSGALPRTLIEDAQVSGFGNLIAGILIVSLGTTIDFPEIKRQWKVVVISICCVLGSVAAIILLGGPIMGMDMAVAGAPIFAGGSAATLIMTTTLKEKGLELAGTFCIVLYVTQKFIGVPIASLLLRRTALRFREEPELVAQYSEQVQETSVQRKRGLLELPALFSRPSVYLAKLGMVAVAAYYTAKLTNGAVHYFVLCLVMGALFFALGFLEKGILAKTQSGGLITFFVTILIFSNLATTTPQQVVSVLVPLLAAAVLGVAGTVAVGFVAGKLLKVPFGLAVSLGISCTFGFPTTMLIPQEVSEAIGRNDREKAAILNYLLPKMLTAGFVTVTIASVLIAGFVVNML
ncbi:hypothetical protein [uncultured Oscillibacter sp.]|jgi:MFS family permease|uniref:hypothetical protein n=1 Tax=uncultured Oscillibacter sp. TaxID=876091 RepID=UPI0025E8FC78|nr:hypothetical protein [uncultured Oscillibacter sp.]